MKAYTYRITHKPSGLHYYGVRYARGCSVDDLWTTYYTSSKSVQELIITDGKDSFSVELRKIFKDTLKAREWEQKVLRRLGVPRNPKWLNRYSGASLTGDEMIEAMQAKYGISHPMESQEFRDKQKQSNLKKYGFENASSSPLIRKKVEETFLRNYGYTNPFNNPEIKAKSDATIKARFGVEFISQSEEIKAKVRASWNERFGGHPLANAEVQKARKESFMEKHGVENQSQLESVKKQKSDKAFAKYGVSCVLQADDVKAKIKATNLAKYGVENVSSNPEMSKMMGEGISRNYHAREPRICPKCRYESKSWGNMLRYHFDNCKHYDIEPLHKGGKTLNEIAKISNLSKNSVIKHLKWLGLINA